MCTPLKHHKKVSILFNIDLLHKTPGGIAPAEESEEETALLKLLWPVLTLPKSMRGHDAP